MGCRGSIGYDRERNLNTSNDDLLYIALTDLYVGKCEFHC